MRNAFKDTIGEDLRSTVFLAAREESGVLFFLGLSEAHYSYARCHLPPQFLPRGSSACSTIIRLHELVRIHHLRKPYDARSVRPRLRLALLPHDAREATRPSLPRESLDNTFDRALSNKFSVQARVVEDGGEVDNRSESADHSRFAQVLVPDDSLADGFGLGDVGLVGFEKVEGEVAAGEFEGEARGGVVCGRGANVVQEGGEEEGLWAAFPGGEVLCYDGAACGVSC